MLATGDILVARNPTCTILRIRKAVRGYASIKAVHGLKRTCRNIIPAVGNTALVFCMNFCSRAK